MMHLRAGEAGGEYCQYVEILDLCSHHLCLHITPTISRITRSHTRLNGCVHCLREMGLANRDQPVALTIQLRSSARFPFFAFLCTLSKKVQSLYIKNLVLEIAAIQISILQKKTIYKGASNRMIDFQRKIMLRYGRGGIALFRVYSSFFCAVAITMSQCQKKHNLPNCFGTSVSGA